MADPLIVLSTFPDDATARHIGTTLVERNLAACVNIIPTITSVFRWEGKIQQDPESLAIIKTTSSAYPALQQTLLDLHPYQTPEILALTPHQGLPAYLDWLTSSTTPNPPNPPPPGENTA